MVISRKCSKLFAHLQQLFFQCTRRFLSFGQIGTKWHTWLTEALKMVTVLHLSLKSKDGWRLPHLKASFYVNTRRENLKLDESCSLDVNQIYTIKKSAYFEFFYFVNFSVGHKMDISFFTFRLFLQNRWANFNRTRHKVFLGEGIQVCSNKGHTFFQGEIKTK